MKPVNLGLFLKKDNNNLDLIRIACALFVIYSHSFPISPDGDSNDILYKITLQPYISFGGLAVKTFFLISGMLVTNSLMSNGNILGYIRSRFFRVFPAYLTTIIVTALIIGPLISHLSFKNYYSSPETWSYIVKNIKMNTQYFLPEVFSENKTHAVNGSLWTIPFEVKAYFYLLMMYLLTYFTGSFKKYIIAIISLAIIIEPLTPFKGMLIAKSTDPSVYLLYPFFALGCLLSIIKDKINNIGILSLSIISIFIYFIVSSDILKTASFYASGSLILIFIASIKAIVNIKIKYDISYGIYLWAFPVQQFIASGLVTSPYINALIAMIISSFFGYASFRLIESPAMNFNKKLRRKSVSIQ